MGNKAIEKAEYLKETKNLIRQALQEQGADITDSDPFRVFASIISNLKTSSGDDAIKVKTGEEIDNMTSEDTLVCICSKDYSYTDYDGVLVEYKRGVIYEVINGSVDKLLFDTDTTNYRELSNKPSINGVELNYNKSLTELGIQPKGDYALKKDLPRNTSELNNDSGFLTEFTEEDPTVPQYIKDITEEDINKWNASEEYKNLKNKPSINGVELNENKSLEELGIQPKGEYITSETDPTIPQYIKDITEEDIARWNSGGDVIIEETDPTVPDHVKSITQEDIDKWNSGADIDINIDDATRRVWSYNPTFKIDPTPNMWSLISNTVYTDKIPKGKYIILYRATIGPGDFYGSTGISTITGGLDGTRLDNTTRNSVPLVNGLLSTAQVLYYVEFTEEKTHSLDVYSYANTVVGVAGVFIDVIRIGDVAGGDGLTVLPIASKDDLGAIKAGDYLKVDEDGTLHVALDGSDGTIITTNNNSRLRDGKYNVIAVNHRGYSTVAPENTLPAYVMSKEKGFNYAECDVSFTSDGVAVLLHDATIDRTSNGSGSVSNMTYEQLLQYDFGSWKSSEYAGTKIPTFEEFITLCKNIGLHPYIELKSNGNYTQEQIVEIVDMVKKNGMKGNVTYISFNKTYLEYIKQVDRQARLGYLVSDITQEIVEDTLSLRSGINEVYLSANYSSATDDNVNTCISYNIPLEIWTVNDENVIKNMNSYISGVTSDSLIAGKILSGISDTTISEEIDPTVPDYVKNITLEDIEKWNSGTGGSGEMRTDMFFLEENQSIQDSTFTTVLYGDSTGECFSTSDGIITCKKSGKYLVLLNTIFDTNTSGGRYQDIRYNDRSYALATLTGVDGLRGCLSSFAILELSENDTMVARAYQTTGSDLNLISGTSGGSVCFINLETITIESKSVISSLEIYSTEETLIGVYENKPLYRKIIAVNQDFKDMDVISLSGMNIETLTHIGSFQTRNNETRYLYDQFYDSPSRKFTPQYIDNNVMFWVTEAEVYTATVWIEYTKTTDEEGTIVVPNNVAVDLTEYIHKDELKTINGNSLIGEGDIVIEGGNENAVPTDFNTKWVNAELTEHFKLYNDSSYCRYAKTGNMVNIQFALSPTSADNMLNSATETTAFKLPEEYRPSQNLNVLCQGSGTNIFNVGVNVSGNVNIYRYRNEANYSSTPPNTTAWLPCNISYFVDSGEILIGNSGNSGSLEIETITINPKNVTNEQGGPISEVGKVQKCGNECKLMLTSSAGYNIPNGTYTVIGVIPEGYRPKENTVFVASARKTDYADFYDFVIVVYTTGDISVLQRTGSSFHVGDIRGSVSYYIDEPMPIGGGSGANLMSLQLTTNQGFEGNTYTKIKFDRVVSIGEKLTFEDNGVKIGKGVKYVKVSAIGNPQTEKVGTTYLRIVKNQLSDVNTVVWVMEKVTNTWGVVVLTLPPKLVEVKEGDILYAYVYGEGYTTVGRDMGAEMSMTVEVVN